MKRNVDITQQIWPTLRKVDYPSEPLRAGPFPEIVESEYVRTYSLNFVSGLVPGAPEPKVNCLRRNGMGELLHFRHSPCKSETCLSIGQLLARAIANIGD